MMYGRFQDVSSQDFRRVVEVNLFGQVHGARAVLPVFRRQRSGVLINMSSVWGRIVSPSVGRDTRRCYPAPWRSIRARSTVKRSLHHRR